MNGILRQLVRQGRLDMEAAQSLVDQQAREGRPLIELIQEDGVVDSASLAKMSADLYGFSLVDFDAINPDFFVKDKVPEELIEKNKVFPIYQRGARMMLATADPANHNALKEIRFATNSVSEYIVVEWDKLAGVLNGVGGEGYDGFSDFDDAALEGLEVADTETDDGSVDLQGAEEAPIVKFVNKILIDAIRGGSSDLHFEPYEKMFRIRYRTDGVLGEVTRPPLSIASRVVARIKIMAKLDTSERRIPQDGRIKLKISKNKAIDFRVSTCPTIWGEKVVMRILDPDSAKMGIDALGYEQIQKERYLKALSKPQGLVLITGPTGSGKTVSLYTGVNILNTPERNISTAEDPVEINLPGVNQVNVNVKQGLTFPSVLRSFLRQDPDVILVGEIRDLETASIAIKASQTGHMVLSTLHTNSAAETLTRLRNMGVPAFSVATSVKLIIAQRLARRLCKSCKQVVNIPKPALLEFGFTEEDLKQGFDIYEPKGCSKCNKGYKGRTGIYEVVEVGDEIVEMILTDQNSLDLSRKFAELGFDDLRRSGLKKVMQGLTSLEEVDRVTLE